MRDSVYNTVLAKVSIAHAVIDADGAVNGTAIDRAEFKNQARAIGVVVTTGTITDGTFAVKLQVSDNNSDWTDAEAQYLQGSLPAIVAANDNVVREFGYVGPGRYVRVVATAATTTDGGALGALVLLGDVRRTPVARS